MRGQPGRGGGAAAFAPADEADAWDGLHVGVGDVVDCDGELVMFYLGAIGLIQVMPSTGARVAALMGEHRYSPGDLENPTVNIRYGAFYLSRLMERFDGVYPLAVGSYNGGPHNVSRWMRQLHGKVTLAEYVELIQYDETRDYVKRVSGHYARYAALYGPEGSGLLIHDTPLGDDASVIDF